MQHRKRQQALWAIILVLSLGSSIALALTSPEVTASSVITHPAESRRYVLALKDDAVHYAISAPYPPDQGRVLALHRIQYPRLSVSSWHIAWIVVQVAAVGMGIALLVSKGLGPASIGRRLDLSFAYLGIAWFSLVVFKIKMAYESLSSLINGMWFSWSLAQPKPYSLGNIAFVLFDRWSLMIIGLGIAIVLAYMWLRWSREGMPEKVFP